MRKILSLTLALAILLGASVAFAWRYKEKVEYDYDRHGRLKKVEYKRKCGLSYRYWPLSAPYLWAPRCSGVCYGPYSNLSYYRYPPPQYYGPYQGPYY